MRLRTSCGLLSIMGYLITCLFMCVFTDLGKSWRMYPAPIQRIFIIAFILTLVDYIWTILWWIAYKPVTAPVDMETFPRITVVIPVYNESHFIRYTLYCILQSSYPKDRLEVVVVDDGSLDNTWEQIATTATAYANAGPRYRTIRHKRNLGKRSAIQSGFSIASGDVIISLDSDSVLERDSLSELVAPLVRDSRIGGVAGHLSVLNVENKTIPRLLDILFDTSGNIPRAAQSQACGAVSILPGAFSAYRTSAIRPLLADLCKTTFLGTPMNHGEDVEMTLGLLRAGWATVYQSNAVVHTIAPETATRAFLMYTRWERSSYVYLFSGFFQVVGAAVIRKLTTRLSKNVTKGGKLHVPQLNKDNSKSAQEGFRNSAMSGMGIVFLLMNLTCTAVSNLIFPFIIVSQIQAIIFRPRELFVATLSTLLLSSFRGVLFFVDCTEQEGKKVWRQDGTTVLDMQNHALIQEDGVTKDCQWDNTKYLRIFSRKARLLWRIQYGGLALLFHTFFIGWSSVVALFTLRSQRWLTR